jgi:hypothetical protein
MAFDKQKWLEQNREDLNRKARENYYKRREHHKSTQLLRRYGISLEEKKIMYENQQGKCAICGVHESEFSDKRPLVVDHNHITNKVRALLCIRCNTLLGIYENYQDQFKEYLSKFDCEN